MNSLSDEPGPVPSSAPDVLPQEITPGPPPMPPSSAKDSTGPDQVLLALREQLQELRQRFEATDAQIAGYLRDQSGPHRGAEANGEALAHVQHSVDRLLSKFEDLASKSESAPASGQTPAKGHQDILDALQKL